MSTPLARLAELGITLPAVVTPLASYVPAVRSGSLVFTSGQVPMVDGALAATGKVGGAVSAEEAHALARTCALNGLAAIDALVGLDSVVRVVKVVGFVASDPHFTGQPGLSTARASSSARCSARPVRTPARPSGSRLLPLDAPVEVELVVEVG